MTDLSLACRGRYTVGILVAYSAFIYYLSSSPLTINWPFPDFFWRDKLFHASAFGLMSMIAYAAFSMMPFVKRPALWATLYAIVYGLSDEWHQYYVPGRTADWQDWVADMLGAVLAIVVGRLVLHAVGKRMVGLEQAHTAEA